MKAATAATEFKPRVPEPTKKEQFSILIVDDIKENLVALKAILERDDVTIHQASSGKLALELLMKHDFCLALLDVQMPEMSGFELAAFMRGSKKTKNIPIIFVTANSKENDFSFKGYESGAVDFLIKPLDAHSVKSKVNIFIELYQQKNELTKTQEDLNHSKCEAERASAAKTQFLAHMSHEIRTPIGAILGFADLMKNPANTFEENRNYMVIVERNSQQLLRLINEILDLSKVESGQMTIENIEFSLSDMLADFISVKTLKAEEKGIEFRFNPTTLIPNLICSDPFRLRQILDNIVGNAIKFTEKGYVELEVSFANPILKFTVSDTGLGISKVQESRLFQPFSQADASTTRKFGGTGLGLILSRRLAESLGGKLEFVSAQASGSTFFAEIKTDLLPQAKLVGKSELSTIRGGPIDFLDSRKVLNGLKVLLVEDSPDNQMLITLYLQREGAEVKSASNGEEGVKLALSENFDVILMDIQMPIMDGHEATKKLRSVNFTKPIVALTAHAMREEHDKCFKTGFTEFLTKPINRDKLIEVLSYYSLAK